MSGRTPHQREGAGGRERADGWRANAPFDTHFRTAARFIEEIFIIIDRFHRVAIRFFGITIALIQHYFSLFRSNGHLLLFCECLRNGFSGSNERDRVQSLHVLHKPRFHSCVTGTICTVPQAVFTMIKIPTLFFDVILVVVFRPLLFDDGTI